MGQTYPQAILGAGQSARHRADRPTEPVRRFDVRTILEETEQHRQAKLVRQPFDFLDHRHRTFVRFGRFHAHFNGRFGNVPNPLANPEGRIPRHPKQVARDRRPPHRTGLPRQHEKRRLKGIFGRMGVVRQFAPADPPDEIRMPTNEQLERCGIAVPGKPREQLRIRNRSIVRSERQQIRKRTRPHGTPVMKTPTQ